MQIASLCADESLAPGADALGAALGQALLKTFPAAFLGRVTLVPYRPLAQASLAHIVALHLDRVVARMMANSHAIQLSYTQDVVQYIVGRCMVQETGARLLIGFIEQHVLPRLASLWLEAFSSRRALERIALTIGDAAASPGDAFVVQGFYGEQVK